MGFYGIIIACQAIYVRTFKRANVSTYFKNSIRFVTILLPAMTRYR